MTKINSKENSDLNIHHIYECIITHIIIPRLVFKAIVKAIVQGHRKFRNLENRSKDRNDGVWSRDNKKEYLMTLDLNHDGVKDYIKRNNLELKNVERKDTHFHNLLRSLDPRTDWRPETFGPVNQLCQSVDPYSG